MMATLRYIDDDIVREDKLGESGTKENLLATLFWGDSVRVVASTRRLRLDQPLAGAGS